LFDVMAFIRLDLLIPKTFSHVIWKDQNFF
jgi:hypothetical protein